MLKLLILTPSLGAGGAERVLSILSSSFADNFEKVIIVVWKTTPVFYSLDSRIEIIWIPRMVDNKGIFKQMQWVRAFVKSYCPNVVLSFLAPYNMLALVSLLGIKVPKLVAERSDPRINKRGKPVRILRNLLYYSASGILCQTENMKNYFKGQLHKKAKVIFNPLLIDEKQIGCAINCPKEDLIVSVGRLATFKNHILLIQAFKKFLEENPGYKLKIFGEGEERDNLIHYIVSQHLEENVFLMGNSTNIFEDIKNAKAFVLSSKYEGMPNALIEAMAIGLPCISTKVSGAVDLIVDGVNGYLCEEDPIQISELLKLIVNNEQSARSVSINATKIVYLLDAKYINLEWISYIKSFCKDF